LYPNFLLSRSEASVRALLDVVNRRAVHSSR